MIVPDNVNSFYVLELRSFLFVSDFLLKEGDTELLML